MREQVNSRHRGEPVRAGQTGPGAGGDPFDEGPLPDRLTVHPGQLARCSAPGPQPAMTAAPRHQARPPTGVLCTLPTKFSQVCADCRTKSLALAVDITSSGRCSYSSRHRPPSTYVSGQRIGGSLPSSRRHRGQRRTDRVHRLGWIAEWQCPR
jgi:hypothetical protein